MSLETSLQWRGLFGGTGGVGFNGGWKKYQSVIEVLIKELIPSYLMMDIQ